MIIKNSGAGFELKPDVAGFHRGRGDLEKLAGILIGRESLVYQVER